MHCNTIAFRKFLDESGLKTKKIWVDHGSEFCSRSIKVWLYDSDLEMC